MYVLLELITFFRDKKQKTRPRQITLPGQVKNSCGATLLDGFTVLSLYLTIKYTVFITESLLRRPYSCFLQFPFALKSPFNLIFSPRSHHPRLSEEKGKGLLFFLIGFILYVDYNTRNAFLSILFTLFFRNRIFLLN